MGRLAQLHATRRQRGAMYLVAERNSDRAQVLHADSKIGAENVARNVMAYRDPVVTLYSSPTNSYT